MGNFTRRGFVGSLSGLAGATMLAGRASGALISPPQTPKASGPIKITDLKCAIIGRNPTVRIVTDQGISGYGQAESAKPYLKPMVLFYKRYLVGEDPTNIAAIMLKIRRMGAGLDLYGRRRDGSEFPVEISLSPVRTDGGTIVLSAIRDISDRKRIEEELRRAHSELAQRTTAQIGEFRARLASIIDSSEDAIIGKELDGTIVSWNKGAEHIYGYTPEEAIGKHISILAPSDRPDEIPEILKRIGRGQTVEHFESIRIAKDGRRLQLSIMVSPLRDALGEGLVNFHDIAFQYEFPAAGHRVACIHGEIHHNLVELSRIGFDHGGP